MCIGWAPAELLVSCAGKYAVVLVSSKGAYTVISVVDDDLHELAHGNNKCIGVDAVNIWINSL